LPCLIGYRELACCRVHPSPSPIACCLLLPRCLHVTSNLLTCVSSSLAALYRPTLKGTTLLLTLALCLSLLSGLSIGHASCCALALLPLDVARVPPQPPRERQLPHRRDQRGQLAGAVRVSCRFLRGCLRCVSEMLHSLAQLGLGPIYPIGVTVVARPHACKFAALCMPAHAGRVSSRQHMRDHNAVDP